MFSLKSQITKDSEVYHTPSEPVTKKVIVSRPPDINMKNAQNTEPVEVIPLPTHSKTNPPVFNYLNEKMDRENEKKKKIKYLPGERMLVSLDKQLRKDQKKKNNEEHIETLNNSINNVLRLLE
jgi:hypothetical protein